MVSRAAKRKRIDMLGAPVDVRPHDGRAGVLVVGRQANITRPTPGSIGCTCDLCGARCWRSPSSLGAPISGIACLNCAIAAGVLGDDAERYTTPEALAELRRSMD